MAIKRTLLITSTVIASMGVLVLLLVFLLGYRERYAGLPPQPVRYPKAFCGPPITHLNVVFWHGWVSSNVEYRPEAFDGFVADPEMERVAKAVVSKFWNGPASVIRTNDGTNVMPKHLGQLVLTFERLGQNRVGVEAQVFQDADVREKIIKSKEEGLSRLDRKSGPRVLKLKSNDDEDFKFFIQSLSDLVDGRCDRVMSDHIISSQKHWKFFPPYEDFNGRGGIGEGIAR